MVTMATPLTEKYLQRLADISMVSEIEEGVKIDQRLDTNEQFRSEVSETIELALMRGKQLTVSEAVRIVRRRKKWKKTN